MKTCNIASKAGGQPSSGVTIPSVIGVAVRVHIHTGNDRSLGHVPPPVEVGELGHGPLLPHRVGDLVETNPHTPLAELGKVARATAPVR